MRKLQTSISYERRCKNPQQKLENEIQQHMKKIIYHEQVRFIPGIQGWVVQHTKVNKQNIPH